MDANEINPPTTVIDERSNFLRTLHASLSLLKLARILLHNQPSFPVPITIYLVVFLEDEITDCRLYSVDSGQVIVLIVTLNGLD